MPIHTTAFISRHKLENPNEKDPPTVEALPYERVLKYNPNHDPKSGKFTASGGGRRGGTMGVPTEDAFGRAIGMSPARQKQHDALLAYRKSNRRAVVEAERTLTDATSAHIRRQAHTPFQTKSGHKHILNPAKTTFRI